MDLIYLLGLLVLLASVAALILVLINDCDLVTLLAVNFGKDPTVLKSKVVWLTGASSGIGEGLAKELAKYGAKVALSARRKEELERVKNECLKINPSLKEKDILVLPLDLVDLKSHGPALEKILNHFGRLDILISNAGRYLKGSWEEVDIEVDKELFEVNVFSLVHMNRLVVKHFLRAGGGHLAVVSSLAGKMGIFLSGPYAASKHALHGYFNSLRMETCGKNIDVTMICPGPVQTPIFTAAFTHEPGETTAGKPLLQEFSENRMTSERCAYLSLVALANRLNEAWLSKFPALPGVYAGVYLPVLSELVLRFAGPTILKKMKSPSKNQ
jgi:dehydrogenase/reductase SDR family protein 7